MRFNGASREKAQDPLTDNSHSKTFELKSTLGFRAFEGLGFMEFMV